MKCFYTKNKKSIWLFIIIFSFLFFYDFFLIGHISDLTKVKKFNDLSKLYELHPYLPLSRLVYNLFPLQNFDHVGFKEIMISFTYVVQSLSIFEIIFLVLILINLYLFLFKQDYVNTLTFSMIGMHIVVFFVHAGYCIFKLFNCLVYVSTPISQSMMDIRFFTIICLAIYSIILLMSLFSMYIIYVNKK